MAALSLGGDVRVGLEDNFYLPDGAMARSNGDLCKAAVKMVRLAGREVATVDEARAAPVAARRRQRLSDAMSKMRERLEELERRRAAGARHGRRRDASPSSTSAAS